MLTLNGLEKSFNKKKVVNNLSCTVHNGDFIVIVGANGSGKTTLFNCISGRTHPDSGSLHRDGQDITAESEQQRAVWVSRLFQDTAVNTALTLTVAENLALATFKGKNVSLKYGLKALAPETLSLIEQLNLTAALNKPISALSGGQRQLIAFIMATILPPQLLLLDEPTAALDPAAATELLTMVARHVKEKRITTLLITHDPHLALTLGNKIWVLDRGTIIKQFDQQDKATLSTTDLIGHIDYQQIVKESLCA